MADNKGFTKPELAYDIVSSLLAVGEIRSLDTI